MLESLAVMAADGTPEPWLATKWTPNDDFTEWEVELRDGVTFQNGEKFDAAAVVVNTMDAINGLVSGQVVKGVIKFGLIALIAIAAIYFLMQGGMG